MHTTDPLSKIKAVIAVNTKQTVPTQAPVKRVEKMSTHTPGSWVEDGRTGSIWRGPAPVNRKTGLRIAVFDISVESEQEDRANIRLCVAAPDLLATLTDAQHQLVAVRAILEAGGDFQTGAKGKHRDLMRTLGEINERALSAIAKAEGRS